MGTRGTHLLVAVPQPEAPTAPALQQKLPDAQSASPSAAQLVKHAVPVRPSEVMTPCTLQAYGAHEVAVLGQEHLPALVPVVITPLSRVSQPHVPGPQSNAWGVSQATELPPLQA
jgi:hypothetical protein